MSDVSCLGENSGSSQWESISLFFVNDTTSCVTLCELSHRHKGYGSRDVLKVLPIIEKESPISALINNKRKDEVYLKFKLLEKGISKSMYTCLPEKGSLDTLPIKVHRKMDSFPIAPIFQGIKIH